jgi:hypothetical protein
VSSAAQVRSSRRSRRWYSRGVLGAYAVSMAVSRDTSNRLTHLTTRTSSRHRHTHSAAAGGRGARAGARARRARETPETREIDARPRERDHDSNVSRHVSTETCGSLETEGRRERRLDAQRGSRSRAAHAACTTQSCWTKKASHFSRMLSCASQTSKPDARKHNPL